MQRSKRGQSAMTGIMTTILRACVVVGVAGLVALSVTPTASAEPRSVYIEKGRWSVYAKWAIRKWNEAHPGSFAIVHSPVGATVVIRERYYPFTCCYAIAQPRGHDSSVVSTWNIRIHAGTYLSTGTRSRRHLLAHELGHTLGYAHDEEGCTVMSPYFDYLEIP